MHFHKPATMLSVSVIEIEATNLAREASRLAQYGVALPFYQFAVAFADTVHSGK